MYLIRTFSVVVGVDVLPVFSKSVSMFSGVFVMVRHSGWKVHVGDGQSKAADGQQPHFDERIHGRPIL